MWCDLQFAAILQGHDGTEITTSQMVSYVLGFRGVCVLCAVLYFSLGKVFGSTDGGRLITYLQSNGTSSSFYVSTETRFALDTFSASPPASSQTGSGENWEALETVWPSQSVEKWAQWPFFDPCGVFSEGLG